MDEWMNERMRDTPPPLQASRHPLRAAGFFRRHRAAILAFALILYTVALGVAVSDEVFHLGLFPTALEREARGYIERFDSPEEAQRRATAEELLRRVDGFVAVPELIRALDHRSEPVRALAAECLRKLTNAELPFDPAAPPAERRAAITHWRKWWSENRERF